MLGHGGIVVFDDTVDMARQARFAFEFCAKESCGKCTPCRIGSTRGVETVDKIIAGREPRGQYRAAARSLRDDDRRLALRARRPDAAAGAQRARSFPRGFRSPRARASRPNRRLPMALAAGTRLPARRSASRETSVTLTIDGAQVSVPEGNVGDGRGRAASTRRSRSSAPPTAWRRSAPAGCAWSRSRAARARPPPAPRRPKTGMVVRTQTPRLAKLRRGVMELYISDHPLDCLTCTRQRRLRIADPGRRRRPARRALRL